MNHDPRPAIRAGSGGTVPVNGRTSPKPARFRTTALDKLMYQVHPFHDGQCRCVITLDGRLDGARMARAVELSLEAAPVLGSRYVCHPWQSRWEKCSPPGSAIAFRQVRAEDPEREIDRFLGEPMDPLRGPQVEVRLVRSARDALCVKLSHLAADATGVLDYIRMLSGLYRRLRTDPDHLPPAVAAEDRGQGQFLRGAGPRALIQGCFHTRYPRTQWGFPQTGSDVSGRAFPKRRVGPERIARLKAYCRTERTNFTDVLVTAFYRALCAVLDPPAGARLPVQLTIDLRRYLPSGKANAICDLAGAYYPVIRNRPGVPFDRTLGDVRAAVTKAKAGHPWLGSALFLELATLMPSGFQTRLAQRIIGRELASGRAHPFLSNLGVIDPRIFDFGDAVTADLGMFGPVTFPPNFLISIYSFRDQLSVTSSFCPTAADPRLVDAFFDRFMEELPA